MNIGRSILLILFLVGIQTETFCATVSGTVKIKRNGTPVRNAQIWLASRVSSKAANVDKIGEFVFNDVIAGTYIVWTSAAGCITRTDTLVVRKDQEEYIMDIGLSEAVVESNPVTEERHRRLREENAKHPILTLKIEHYTMRHGVVTLFPSVSNNTDESFFIIRQFECVNYFSAIISDFYGKQMQPNSIRIDCMGEKIFPTREDRIQIPPHRTIDCPPIQLESNNFNGYPRGTYFIRLKYHFEKPATLAVFNFTTDYRERYGEVIEVLATALRGEFLSSNMITIENTH